MEKIWSNSLEVNHCDIKETNNASEKINFTLYDNLSAADLEVINRPSDDIYNYFMEIKAIPLEDYNRKIFELDYYFSDRLITECEKVDEILCDILKIFGLQNTLKIYQDIMHKEDN